MPIEQLKADLERLRIEIAAADSGDREALRRLRALADRIEREIEQEQTLADPGGFVEEFEEAASRFEVKHPNLAAVINNIVVVLGGMGV